MDSDPDKKIKGSIPDAGNVLFATWLRCSFPFTHGSHWVILDGRRYLLLPFRLFLVGLYLAYQAYK